MFTGPEPVDLRRDLRALQSRLSPSVGLGGRNDFRRVIPPARGRLTPEARDTAGTFFFPITTGDSEHRGTYKLDSNTRKAE